MKFNKKSLVKVAILSAILGLNGMCFNDVVNGAEVAVEKAVVRNVKCEICGDKDSGTTLSLTRRNLCVGCIQANSGTEDKNGKIRFVLNPGFIKKYNLTSADGRIIKKEIEERIQNFSSSLEGFPREKCSKCGFESLFTFKSGVSMCYNCFINSDAVDSQRDSSDQGAIDYVLTEKFIKDYALTEEDWKIMNESFKEIAEQNHVPGFRIAKDGFPKVRAENKEPKNEDICPVCYDRKPIKLLCCGNFMCENCILKQNAKRSWGDGLINTNCPFCRCSGNVEMKDQATGAKFDLSRKSAWNEMVKLAKELKQRVAEKENSGGRTLADDLNRFDGDHVSFAREQENYANQRLAELTNERAWQLLDEGRVKEVEHMFDEADSYRKDKEILRKDVRAAIGQTNSNCSQNTCGESERSELTSYQPKSFTSDALSDSQVQELIDQGYFN